MRHQKLSVQQMRVRLPLMRRTNSCVALATPEDSIRAVPHHALIVHGRDDRIVPLTSSCAFDGTYSVDADTCPGFTCTSDVISVQAPGGVKEYEIVGIRYV